MPGIMSGASQKAFHFSRSITSGVSSTLSVAQGAGLLLGQAADAAGDQVGALIRQLEYQIPELR